MLNIQLYIYCGHLYMYILYIVYSCILYIHRFMLISLSSRYTSQGQSGLKGDKGEPGDIGIQVSGRVCGTIVTL